MKQFVKRKNRLFIINENQLKPKAKTTENINALYAAIYLEFRGAINNPKYTGLNDKQRLEKVNLFACNWLKDRGLE